MLYNILNYIKKHSSKKKIKKSCPFENNVLRKCISLQCFNKQLIVLQI